MLRVLHLEDSRLDAELVAAQLAESGLVVEVDRVETRAAFQAAIGRHPPHDLVLCDYNVPGFPGEDALALAREQHPDVPVLFVSGALGEHAAVELLKRGATDYVLKDRLDRLVPSIERALREAREKRERLLAEERLRERERTLSALMKNLPGMVFRTRRGGPWRFALASEGCLALTGHPPETFMEGGPMAYSDIVHPEDVLRLRAESPTAFDHGGPYTTTYRIRTRSGEERWVWARAVVVPGEAGQPAWVEGFVTDITLQKQAESELARRIEFEQQLVGIVSHDLRNPLNTITLGANALLRREGADELTTKLARRILGSAERATRMIRDLLDFTQARLGSGVPVSPQRTELAPIVENVLEELEHLSPDRRIELSTEPAIDGLWDPDRIAQVLQNLVSNALAYSPSGTPVRVRVARDGEHARIEVHNEGEPIPPERLPELWKPMVRGIGSIDPRTRSIGLGLFIVERIVTAHHGEVSARSTAEEGTTFVVRLPRRAPAGQPLDPS